MPIREPFAWIQGGVCRLLSLFWFFIDAKMNGTCDLFEREREFAIAKVVVAWLGMVIEPCPTFMLFGCLCGVFSNGSLRCLSLFPGLALPSFANGQQQQHTHDRGGDDVCCGRASCWNALARSHRIQSATAQRSISRSRNCTGTISSCDVALECVKSSCECKESEHLCPPLPSPKGYTPGSLCVILAVPFWFLPRPLQVLSAFQRGDEWSVLEWFGSPASDLDVFNVVDSLLLPVQISFCFRILLHFWNLVFMIKRSKVQCVCVCSPSAFDVPSSWPIFAHYNLSTSSSSQRALIFC